MAEIIERLGQNNLPKASSQSTGTDEGSGGFKMSAEITIKDGFATYSLASGSTGYTCFGSFLAPGMPDQTTLSFSENDGMIRTGPDAKLQGTLGVMVFNMDSLLSKKGILTFYFLTQDREKENIIAVFTTPKAPDQALKNMPDLQSTGWGGWSAPGAN